MQKLEERKRREEQEKKEQEEYLALKESFVVEDEGELGEEDSEKVCWLFEYFVFSLSPLSLALPLSVEFF